MNCPKCGEYVGLANELKLPPKQVFNDDDFPALWFNLHDPDAMKAAFDSLPMDVLFPTKSHSGTGVIR